MKRTPEQLLADVKCLVEQIAGEEDYYFEPAVYDRMTMFYLSGLYSAVTECVGIKCDPEIRRHIEALCNQSKYRLPQK
jgi:hypothetical protein